MNEDTRIRLEAISRTCGQPCRDMARAVLELGDRVAVTRTSATTLDLSNLRDTCHQLEKRLEALEDATHEHPFAAPLPIQECDKLLFIAAVCRIMDKEGVSENRARQLAAERSLKRGDATQDSPADAVCRILGITVEPGDIAHCPHCQEPRALNPLSKIRTQQCYSCGRHSLWDDWRPHLTIDWVLAAIAKKHPGSGASVEICWFTDGLPKYRAQVGHVVRRADTPLDALNAAVIAWNEGRE